MLGKIEGKRRRGQHGMSWLNSITDSIDMNLSKLQEIVDKDVWLPEVHGFTKRHDLVTEQQQQSRDIAIKVSLKDELSQPQMKRERESRAGMKKKKERKRQRKNIIYWLNLSYPKSK